MHSKGELVSVVLSVYNGEAYIIEALTSVSKQTYSNLEIVVINDGSTDSTESLIKAYQRKDSRVVLVSRPNQGLVASLNEGVSLTRGEYIARMDADDVCKPFRIDHQLQYLKEWNLDLVGGAVDIVRSGEVVSRSNFLEYNNDIKASILSWGQHFCHPTILAKRNLFDRYQYENYVGAEDFALWIRLALDSDVKIGNYPEVVLEYRDHDAQVTKEGGRDWHKELQLETMKGVLCGALKVSEAQVVEFHELICSKNYWMPWWRRRILYSHLGLLFSLECLELETKKSLFSQIDKRLKKRRRPKNKAMVRKKIEKNWGQYA